ncbi:MAG: hypothetical protein CM1200mP2_54120 [Planctomycetaceae bacterium]|nr:MAG: hypothetical protein CM1200mP2_54120 [Planctomycetaceae bacterium]
MPCGLIPWSEGILHPGVCWANTAAAGDSPGVLPSRGVPGLPRVVLAGKHQRSPRSSSDEVWSIAGGLRRSRSEGECNSALTQRGWGGEMGCRAGTGAGTRWRRITAGAAGTLASGRLVLACHEWRKTPGTTAHVGQKPAGVHRYQWRGFRCQSTLRILISDEEAGAGFPVREHQGGGAGIGCYGDSVRGGRHCLAACLRPCRHARNGRRSQQCRDDAER